MGSASNPHAAAPVESNDQYVDIFVQLGKGKAFYDGTFLRQLIKYIWVFGLSFNAFVVPFHLQVHFVILKKFPHDKNMKLFLLCVPLLLSTSTVSSGKVTGFGNINISDA